MLRLVSLLVCAALLLTPQVQAVGKSSFLLLELLPDAPDLRWLSQPVVRERTVISVEGELVPVLGRLNSERVPDYHRLDVRVSRKWQPTFGALTFFLDVQNLYNRKNVAGFDLRIDEEAREIIANEELWPGFFASLGIALEF